MNIARSNSIRRGIAARLCIAVGLLSSCAAEAAVEVPGAAVDPTSQSVPVATETPTPVPRSLTELSVSFESTRDDLVDAFGEFEAGAGSLRDESIGVWVFLAGNDQVDSIRVEAPFVGEIEGVAVGHTLDTLLALKGDPLRDPWDFGEDRAYIFDRIGGKVRYDISPAGTVRTIFLLN